MVKEPAEQLKVIPLVKDSVMLYSGSMLAIEYSKRSKFHGNTKYIKIVSLHKE